MAQRKSQGNPAENSDPYVAIARTALSGPEDCIMKKLPDSYVESSVGEVIKYLTDRKQLSEEELTTARSLESEMRGNYTVSVNGHTVRPEESVKTLFETKAHRGSNYKALEIEIASVQEGGLFYILAE